MLRHTAGTLSVYTATLLIIPVVLPAMLPDSVEGHVLPYAPTFAAQAMYNVGTSRAFPWMLSPGRGWLDHARLGRRTAARRCGRCCAAGTPDPRRRRAVALMVMPSIRSAVRRRPLLVDGLFAAGVGGISAPLAVASGASGSDWFWPSPCSTPPLVYRRRAPVVVFWTVVAAVLASAWAGAAGPSLVIVPMVAWYSIARYRHRRYLWPTAVPMVLFVAAWIYAGGHWCGPGGPVRHCVVAAVLLGTNVQTRRAYLAELEDRARRLERERDQQARLAVAAERARIAREMHDIVAHNLAVIVALADGADRHDAGHAGSGDRHDGQGVDDRAGRRYGEIRRLVGPLREDADELAHSGTGASPTPQPGFDDIDTLIDQVRAAGLPGRAHARRRTR